MDESTVKWNKDRYTEIQDALKPYIKNCGFDLDRDIKWIPVSGLSGDNLKDAVDKKVCNWYTGPPLLDLIDQVDLPARDPNGPIRIPILDKMKDRGTVIFGKVE